MRVLARWAALLGCIALFACNTSPDEGWKIRSGDPAPDFSLPDLAGKTVSLADFSGKIVVFSLFATYCPPCLEELPRLENEVWQPLKDKGVVLIAVNRGEAADDVRSFAQEHNFRFPVLIDPEDSFGGRIADPTIPRLVVVDRRGRVALLETGYSDENFTELIQKVRELAAD